MDTVYSKIELLMTKADSDVLRKGSSSVSLYHFVNSKIKYQGNFLIISKDTVEDQTTTTITELFDLSNISKIKTIK
jgi:hypothetical protein